MMALRVAALLLLMPPAALGADTTQAPQACPNSTDPTLKMLTRVSEACFLQCPQLCEPVGALVLQHVDDGHDEAMKLRVCLSQEDFGCMFKPENARECRKLLEAGDRMGLELPESMDDLSEQCSPRAEGKGACPGAQSPSLRTITDLSPECFAGCPQSCRPLDALAAAYAKGNGTELQERVCSAREQFSCWYKRDNIHECHKVLKDGSRIGLGFPKTMEELDAQCDGQGGACPYSTNPSTEMIVNFSAACFKNCAEACRPLDVLVRGYLRHASANSLVQRVCAHQKEFGCLYEPENLAECSKVLDAGSRIGVSLPKTKQELEKHCTETVDEEGVCPKAENPTLRAVTDLSPECFHECPKLCEPMDRLVTEYVKHGDEAALKEIVCSKQHKFECMFKPSHLLECRKVLVAGPKLGMAFPQTKDELEELCDAFRQAQRDNRTAQPESDPGTKLVLASLRAAPALQMAAPAACPGGKSPMLPVVTDLAPACFEACPQLCQSLDVLVGEYVSTANTEALKREVCASEENFNCVFQPDNIEKCKKFLEAGSMIGVELPMSKAAFAAECHQVVEGETKDTPPARHHDMQVTTTTGAPGDVTSRASRRSVWATAFAASAAAVVSGA